MPKAREIKRRTYRSIVDAAARYFPPVTFFGMRVKMNRFEQIQALANQNRLTAITQQARQQNLVRHMRALQTLQVIVNNQKENPNE